MDPESNSLYIHSHTAVFVNSLVPGNPAQTDMAYVAGQARAAGGPGREGRRVRVDLARAGGPARPRWPRGRRPVRRAAGPPAARRGGTTCRACR